MAILLYCSGCGAQLQLADEHAGRLARCPACGVTTSVPLGPPGGGVVQPPPQSPSDWMQPEWSQPLQPSPSQSQPSQPPWQQPQRSQLPTMPPSYSDPVDPTNPYAASPYRGGAYSNLPPHRGTLVLVLGIMGLVCCAIFGPMAWIFGAADLKAMRSGQMDPAGESTTQIGMILGIISSVLLGLGVAFYALVLVIAIAGGK
ncbi:MAG: hypothetical protein K8T25_00905 [Planctomycetia bacterium]|nr:hypothetical protein [Planctomycetia bacterium]